MNMNKATTFTKSLVALSIFATALVGYSAASFGQNAPAGAPPRQAKAPRVSTAPAPQNGMMVRISEIEIYPRDLARYQAILREEAEASVRLEPGVASIFPMVEQKNPTQVRILEIYASRVAYQSHLKTPHFQKYKTSTLKMVKSLRLVDMNAIDAKTMARMFSKMKR